VSNLPTMDQLQLVISQAAAPAFILGAVASFLSVLLSHMGRIIDRSRAIHDLAESDPKKERLKANLPQLRLRARILHRAIYWAVGSGIVTCLRKNAIDVAIGVKRTCLIAVRMSAFDPQRTWLLIRTGSRSPAV
jgi:Protein of unknown function (DUF2721)